MATYIITSSAFRPVTIEAEFVDNICVDLDHDADESNPFVGHNCFDLLTFAVIDGGIDSAECAVIRDYDGKTSITWSDCVCADDEVISRFSINVARS